MTLNTNNKRHQDGIIPSQLFAAIGLMQDLEGEKQLYHSWRMALIGSALARKMSPEHEADVFFATMLAEVGALHFPRHIVHSLADLPASINQKSKVNLFFHPEVAYEITRSMPNLKQVAKLVRVHHENLDGSGYPRGLRREQLDVPAQILRVSEQLEMIIRSDNPENLKEIQRALKPYIGESLSQETYDTLYEILTENGLFATLLNEEKLAAAMEKQIDHLSDKLLFTDKQQVDQFIDVLGDLIDTRNQSFSKGQARNIRNLAAQIGIKLGLNEHQLRHLHWAGNLQNIGEVSLRNIVLGKKTPLEDEERRLIKQHPVQAYQLLSQVEGMEDVAKIARHHHENYNGSGYPDGLAQDTIPIESRIIRVADTFFAMVSERPYRRKRDWKRAANELKSKSGKFFDPEVVEKTMPLLMNQ